MMRRAFYPLAPLIIAVYLYALWSDWFTRAELSSVGKRPVFSQHINLLKAGSIVWQVPRESWTFTDGEAHLALSLNLHTLREIPADRNQFELRIKVRAEGLGPNGEWQKRLIHDKYFTTDEPFSKAGSSLWESYGIGRLEYGLAGVSVVSGEELRITLDVQVPDGLLMSGHPRLKLVGNHDPAGLPQQVLILFVVREGGFWLSVFLVVMLAIFAWRGGKDHMLAGNPIDIRK